MKILKFLYEKLIKRFFAVNIEYLKNLDEKEIYFGLIERKKLKKKGKAISCHLCAGDQFNCLQRAYKGFIAICCSCNSMTIYDDELNK